MYSACVINVQIRDVPDDVHRELTRRAAAAGQSLQQFLNQQLAKLVERPTLEEMIARVEARDLGQLSFEQSRSALADERVGR